MIFDKIIKIKMKNIRILLFLILFSFCCQNDYDPSDSTINSDIESYSYDFSDFSISSTITNNSTVDEQQTKIILVAFQNYTIFQKLITFNVFFKRIYGYIGPKKLKITLHIFDGILRNLKEETHNVECESIIKDDIDNIIFNCSQKTELDNVIKVSVDRNYLLFDENGNPYNNNLLTFLTGYANRTIGDIQNETKEAIKDFVFLQNSTIMKDEPKFYVMGNFSEKIVIKDNTVTLYINNNENGKIKEIPCVIENKIQYYELECSTNETISFYLDNIDGKMSDKILIISMNEWAEEIINITIAYNNYGKKSSDKGLKTGAIIAIAIACFLVAILAALIIALLFRKTTKPPVKNKTEVDIYSNVGDSSQQNI